MKLPEGFNFTQSNLKDYIDCPYRFYLKYILGIKWPALQVDDALEFELRGKTGARFHRLVQQYLSGIPDSRLTEIAESDPAPEMSQWWANFLADIPPRLEGQRYVETLLRTPLEGHHLLAKYDLILLRDPSRLSIYDWKTSQKRPRKAWLLEHVQTRLYRFLLTRVSSTLTKEDPIDPKEITMNYWFANHPGAPVELDYSLDDYVNDGDFFKKLISEILDRKQEDFTRTDDLRKCKYCLYRSHCDRGIGAGDLESYETFEVEGDDFELDLDFDAIQEIEF